MSRDAAAEALERDRSPAPLPALIGETIDELCARFAEGGYNPTPVVDLGALVANADGTVDADEVAALVVLLQRVLGTKLDAELVGYLIEASLEVIREAGLEPRARLIAQVLVDCDAVRQGLIVALAVAYASDGFSETERQVVSLIAREARFPAHGLDALAAEVARALGVDPDE